jgi:DNA-binding NarL/FixJ family response regulator
MYESTSSVELRSINGKLRPIRLLILDPQALLCAGLRILFESYPDIDVIGAACTCTESLSGARQGQPDVILLHHHNGDDRFLKLLPELLSASPESAVVVLTNGGDSTRLEAIRLGARGIVPKEKTAKDLHTAIRKVHEGELWLDRSLMSSIIVQKRVRETRESRTEGIHTLTAREKEIALLVCQGCTNKEVALRLAIRETTVRHHTSAILAKLQLSSRVELVIFIYRGRHLSSLSRKDSRDDTAAPADEALEDSAASARRAL